MPQTRPRSRWRRCLDWAGAREPLSLRAFLAIAVAVRVPAVLCSRGYEFLDQQYQYVDPAWHLASGDSFLLTPEWILGTRSWVYPWLLSQAMHVAAWFADAAPAQMIVVRALHALVSLLPLVAIWHLLQRRGFIAARPLLLFAASNGIAIYQGVQPNGPALACQLVVFAVCLFAAGGARASLLAGLALGLAFCCRPQDGLFGVSAFAAGMVARRFRDAFLLAAGSLALLAVQGLVDLATWGSFLHSPIAYVRFQLIEGHNAAWGREPWFTYLLLVLALCVPLAPRAVVWLAAGARRLPVVAACAFFSLLAHSFIAHKMPRFVTPSLWLVLLLWGLGALCDPRRGRARRVVLGVALAVHAAGFLLASFSYPHRANIEAARFVGAQPDNRGVVYWDLMPVAAGGSFWYRSAAPQLATAPERLGEVLRAGASGPNYLLARADAEVTVPPGVELERLREFTPWLSSRRHRTMVVYRVIRR